MKEELRLTVNGKKHRVEIDPETPLLYVLRNQLALNGPKYGCGLEQCGACMVLMDGKADPSCKIPVIEVVNKEITTLEGLISENGDLHPLQEAFVQEQAAQCGFCLNGMLISGAWLLQENSNPDRDAINEKLKRVLCRCGTHTRVIKAIQTAAKTK